MRPSLAAMENLLGETGEGAQRFTRLDAPAWIAGVMEHDVRFLAEGSYGDRHGLIAKPVSKVLLAEGKTSIVARLSRLVDHDFEDLCGATRIGIPASGEETG